MTSLERAERPAGWAEPPARIRFLLDAWTIAEGELRKLRHDPTELLTRAVQPLLWLLVFGQVIANTRAIPTGSLGYMDFLAPGILAQSALFSAIFFGIAVIWERDLGVLHKYLVSPAVAKRPRDRQGPRRRAAVARPGGDGLRRRRW